MNKLKIGDYVLATKYNDGDPKDHFAIGFIHAIKDDRFIVVDSDGVPFRASGFRRVQKISVKRGAWLVSRFEKIEQSDKSLWWWVRQTMKRKPNPFNIGMWIDAN